jgi:N utilization substance protein B
MTSTKRTRAREVALQALYQEDLAAKAGKDPRTVTDFEPFISEATQDAEVRTYVRQLLDGTLAAKQALDERIAAAAANWRLSRLAPIDRCILRLALFELMEHAAVPPKVVINEAIELAKKFSTAQSGAFVNGVLDRLWRDSAQDPGDPMVTPERGSG